MPYVLLSHNVLVTFNNLYERVTLYTLVFSGAPTQIKNRLSISLLGTIKVLFVETNDVFTIF